MKVRTFEELKAGDPRSRRISSLGGLGTRGGNVPHVAADLPSQAVATVSVLPSKAA